MQKPPPTWEIIRYKGSTYLHIYEPIFRKNLYVAIRCNTQVKYSKFLSKIHSEDDELPLDARARSMISHFGDCYLSIITFFEKTNPTPGVIAHEVMHTVIRDMGHVGIKLSDESEEVYTYLTSFYTDIITDFIKDKKYA